MSGFLPQCVKKTQHCYVSRVFINTDGMLKIIEIHVANKDT